MFNTLFSILDIADRLITMTERILNVSAQVNMIKQSLPPSDQLNKERDEALKRITKRELDES